MLANRAAAGHALAATLQPDPDRELLVVAISREGLAVGVHVAAAFGAGIELLCVKHSAVATLIEGIAPDVKLDHVVAFGLHAAEVSEHLAQLQADLDHMVAVFRGHRPFPRLHDCHVFLIDDGLAPPPVLDAVARRLRDLQAGIVTVAVQPSAETERVGDLAALALLQRGRLAAQPLRVFRAG